MEIDFARQRQMDGQIKKAQRDAMYDCLAQLPDPVQYARQLEVAEPWMADALRDAYRGTCAQDRGYWKVAEMSSWRLRLLRKYGLIAVGTRCLGGWACKVRAALVEDAEI